MLLHRYFVTRRKALADVLNESNLIGEKRCANISGEFRLHVQGKVHVRPLFIDAMGLKSCLSCRMAHDTHRVFPQWPPRRSAVIGADFVFAVLNVASDAK